MTKTKIKKLIKKNGLFIIFQITFILITLYFINNTTIGYKLNLLFRNFYNSVLFKNDFFKDKDIILVKIDNKFFKKENISIQGLHRGYYATAIKNLHDAGVASIGIDILFENKYHFSETDKFGKILNKIFNYYDKLLANQLSPKDVLGTIFLPPDKFIKPDKIFLKNGSKLGHVTSADFPQLGGIVLGVYQPGLDKENNQIIYPLGLETVKTYYHLPIYFSGNFILYKLGDKIIKIPISEYFNKKFIFLPIYADNENWKIKITNISLYDVIHKTEKFKNINRNNKIVLIGATDPTLNDYKLSYNGLMPGVIFHWNFIYTLKQQILQPDKYGFIYILSNIKEKKLLYTLLLINILIIISIYLWSNKKNRENNYDLVFYYTIVSTIFIFITFMITPLISINIQGFYIFLPIGSIILTNSIFLIANLGYSLILSRNLQKLFDKLVNTYIGEHVKYLKINNIENITQKVSRKSKVGIFFSDIASFTSISEKLSAEEVIDMINIYLEEMSIIIKKHGGIIDKYIGDAIMAYWEDKNTDNIVTASIENINTLPKVNYKIEKKLNRKINLNIRIGLHFGEVTMGDVGSSFTRFNFTIIGDNVNLASRLEGINKYYFTNICASEDIIKNLYKKNRFLFRKLDKIKVKGKEKPILIYEIFPKLKENLSTVELKNLNDLITKFEEALNDYFLGKFKKALDNFKYIYDTFGDQTSVVFIKRCEWLIKNPPHTWEGIWKFNVK